MLLSGRLLPRIDKSMMFVIVKRTSLLCLSVSYNPPKSFIALVSLCRCILSDSISYFFKENFKDKI
jgi:hypothetical protein